MKTLFLMCLALGLPVAAYAQGDSRPAAIPPPLPPPPWLKRAPSFSQWVISFATPGGGKKATANNAQTPSDAGPAAMVAVTKTPGLLLEITKGQNGAVVRKWCAVGLFLLQIGNDWLISPSTVQNSFSDIDYLNSDFSGFDWISEKNYTGVTEIARVPCLTFQDKVITITPREADITKTAFAQHQATWQDKQLAVTKMQKHPGKQVSVPSEASPPSFDINNYKRDVAAYINAETGMPVMLTYKTLQGGIETRTYTFQTPPTVALTLPAEAQQLVDSYQQRLKRLAAPAAVP